MTATTYNPIYRAASAAWSELSTPEAMRWYRSTAWDATLNTYAIAGALVTMTIGFIQIASEWVADCIPPSPHLPADAFLPEPLALPPAPDEPSTDDPALPIEIAADTSPPTLAESPAARKRRRKNN